MQWTLEDILALRETDEVEFKKAAGKDGKGAVPHSLWETYSAFANTSGGDIFLGIEEKADGGIEVAEIADFAKLQQELFTLANNRQKVSVNLLTNKSVEEIALHGKRLLRVHIPRAGRKQRPVYVGENPLKGTYRRMYQADCLLSDAAVKRMLAEQGEDVVDGRILERFGVEDLNQDTLDAYRNIFAARTPNHPFLGVPPLEFLRQIGAWRRDRETGAEGLTLAGLLMFGKLRSILDEVPHYILDYVERPAAKTENRWIDRITTDFTWSGNLYDFYRRVYPKLTQDLKTPFQLREGLRVDETPVHEALRESLVNALIHADFSGKVSIYIVKRPDMFGFRNPGLMRVPFEEAIQGGHSDCRNRNLQKMFQLIGAGDQAGSGIPKIYQNWKEQNWRQPRILELADPEQTRFELHMGSLLPEATLHRLEIQFGINFSLLSPLERLILGLADTEELIDHRRVKELCTEHPADVSKALKNLVNSGFISASGAGRGTSYQLAKPKQIFLTRENSEGLPGNSEGLPENSEGLPGNSEGLDGEERDIVAQLKGARKKLNPTEMQEIVTLLCKVRPQSIQRLAGLIDRSPDYLRQSVVKRLLTLGRLAYLYPSDPNHPEQAYVAVVSSEELVYISTYKEPNI